MEKPDGSKEKGALAEVFERIWGQALVTVSAAEDEVAKVVGKVQGLAGWSQEEVRRQGRELTERLVSQRRELERNLDEGVRRAVAVVRLPRREEIQAASERMDRLAERIEALVQKQKQRG